MNGGPGLAWAAAHLMLACQSASNENWAKKWGKNKVNPTFNVKVWSETKKVQFASCRNVGLELVATVK